MSFRKIALGLLLTTGLLSAPTAQAQFMTGLLPEGNMSFKFVTIPEADDNLMHILIYNPTPVQGCANIDTYLVEQDIRGVDLYLEVEHPIVSPDRKVRNPHYDCNKGDQVAQTIVTINKTELMEKGVNKMTIKTPARTMRFEMDINEDMVHLTNALPDIDTNIEHWFVPDNAVLLTVPMAYENIEDNMILMDQIHNVAALRNLTPIEDVKPGFTLLSGNEKDDARKMNHFVFLDETGIMNSLLEDGQPVKIGHIETTEKFYGPEGQFDKPKQLPVYAGRIGLTTN